MPHDFQCTVGYYLIGIHICRRTSSSLNHVYRELIVKTSFQNFTASLRNGLKLFIRQQAELMIGAGSCHLGHGQPIDK